MSETASPLQPTSQHGVSSKTNDDANIEMNAISTSSHGNSEEEKEKLRLLKIRKKQELKLVKKYDKTKINVSKECFFLIDSDWLNAWAAFVNGDENEDPPGPMSTKQLLDENKNPLPNLQAIRDYRGVSAIVYFIFLELYGKDDSPEIARYVIDIYKVPVSVAKMVNIQVTARSEAKIHVNRVRPKWIKWEREYEDDDDDEFALCGGWCCGLSKEHIEAFIYWAIMCWARSRRKSGRGDISYRKYRPLRANGALQEEEAAAEAKHAQDMADREASEQEPAWLAARREAEAKREADAKREAAARGAGAQTEGGKGTPTTTAAGKKKKRAVSGQQQPVNRKNNSAAAARAAQQLANTRHILHRRELNSESESSSSSDEEEYMLQSAPADKGVEKGTWFSPSRWGSFGR